VSLREPPARRTSNHTRRTRVPGTALITGVTGQDGTYLGQMLLSAGYHVYGLVRGQNNPRLESVARLCPGIEFIEGDLLDHSSLVAALESCQPTEVYNLGAISFVGLSFKQALLTGEVTGLGVVRMLEAIRTVNPDIRFYQASSSEMFGKVRESPQTELTAFHPRSPYGVAKVYGHYITVNYRESYGMFACSGILFNHESPRRGLEFVTRKITNAAAKIKLGLQKQLQLGNLESQRDWGFAGDYVEAMHLMMQEATPDDFVIATGVTHSVREFCDIAFSHLGLDYRDHVVSDDARFLRPAEVDLLIGDASKARQALGWQPKVPFADLVTMMVEGDLAAQQKAMRNDAAG
jgi:GDPmannose 4,6-dehydratase